MRSVVPDGVGRVVRRAGWSIIDQVLSALSNVVLSILVAKTVDAPGFGAFSTAFLVFSLLLALTRAIIASPLQITYAASEGADFHHTVRSALGATLLLGLGAGTICVLTGLALNNQTGDALIALGVCLPPLLVQDICRMTFFSMGSPGRAAAIDAVWTVLEFGLLAALLTAGTSDVRLPIIVWGASAAVSAAVALRMLRALPRIPGAAGWTLRQRRLTGYLLAEYVLGQGLGQVGILMVAVVGSTDGVGALRAAQVLLGPLGILGTATFLFAVPEIARRPAMDQRRRRGFVAVLSAGTTVATIVYCAPLLFVPDELGRRLLGDTWSGAKSVLLPMCLLSVASALGTGPAAMLYGMGHAKVTFSINVIKAPLLVALMFVGISLWDAQGAAWAIFATEALLLPIWFLRTGRIMRSHPTAPDDPILVGDTSIAGAAESAGRGAKTGDQPAGGAVPSE